MSSFSVEGASEMSARAQRDWGLVQEALAGSEPAYEQIVRLYRKSIFHLVMRMLSNRGDAEDLTMETFAKAFRSLPRYKPEFAFSTWLFRIATNHCIDFVRRKKLNTQSLQAPLATGSGDNISWDVADQQTLNPQDAFIRRQRIEFVQHLVTRLPAKYEKLVRLRYFEEMTYEEVAAELKVPLGTVKAQLFRARELLMALLEGSNVQ